MRLSEFLREAGPNELRLPTDHLSVSQTQMIYRCAEQYRHRYVLGKKERPGAALIVGSAFHSAIEQDFNYKLGEGELLPEKELREIYHDSFDKQVEDRGGVSEIVWDKQEKPDTARLHGEEVTFLYHERTAPMMNPAAVEHRFELEIPGLPIPVVGVIDFIGARDGSPFLADYKTSNRAKRSLETGWLLQGRVYQRVEPLPVEWHVVVKGSKPNVITPLDAPDLFQFLEPGTNQFVDKTFQQAAKLVSFYMTEFGPDEPWPTTGLGHSWACSFCGFKTACPAWSLQ